MASIPLHYTMLYSSQQIAQRVRELGALVSDWAADVAAKSEREVVAVPVLRGGIFFFADLVRAISGSVEIAPAQARTYEQARNEISCAGSTLDLRGVSPKGRSILLVDDICDSGTTLRAMSDALFRDGAAEVQAAVLIHRIAERSAYTPRWRAFEYRGPEWFVGFGMDDRGQWRNLPAIYITPPG